MKCRYMRYYTSTLNEFSQCTDGHGVKAYVGWPQHHTCIARVARTTHWLASPTSLNLPPHFLCPSRGRCPSLDVRIVPRSQFQKLKGKFVFGDGFRQAFGASFSYRMLSFSFLARFRGGKAYCKPSDWRLRYVCGYNMQWQCRGLRSRR